MRITSSSPRAAAPPWLRLLRGLVLRDRLGRLLGHGRGLPGLRRRGCGLLRRAGCPGRGTPRLRRRLVGLCLCLCPGRVLGWLLGLGGDGLRALLALGGPRRCGRVGTLDGRFRRRSCGAVQLDVQPEVGEPQVSEVALLLGGGPVAPRPRGELDRGRRRRHVELHAGRGHEHVVDVVLGQAGGRTQGHGHLVHQEVARVVVLLALLGRQRTQAGERVQPLHHLGQAQDAARDQPVGVVAVADLPVELRIRAAARRGSGTRPGSARRWRPGAGRPRGPWRGVRAPPRRPPRAACARAPASARRCPSPRRRPRCRRPGSGRPPGRRGRARPRRR